MNDKYESGDRREQRQQPRFNRREFLAQQQAAQNAESSSMPPTISREERVAHHHQPERQHRQQREDRPARPQRDPDMTLSEFRNKLSEIKWLFNTPREEQSFHSVVESMEQQIKLYNMARRLSGAYLEAFVDAQKRAHQEMLKEAVSKKTIELCEFFDKLGKTGDQELDSFRQRCRDHDWTWSYSDDGAVARAGQAYEEALLQIVRERGGLYEAYFLLCMGHFRG